jgi:starch synthase (maltosyl-transferring)
VIEGVSPEIDGGAFPVKRAVGEAVTVEADAFTDGHDVIACVLLHRSADQLKWSEAPMAALGNDRWQGTFSVAALGDYRYTITAWVDAFLTWHRDFLKWREAKQDLTIAFLAGAQLIKAAAGLAKGADGKRLTCLAQILTGSAGVEEKERIALDDEMLQLMRRYPDRRWATTYKELTVVSERPRARFSSWYEFFPRSCGAHNQHGTFKDCEARLPYVAAMGFDVIYFPPIHPIGRTQRKGKNNALEVEVDDVGSPWAIGATEGGHKAVHPALGTLADFQRFISQAAEYGMEIALDIAFQCSPDHPYVQQHPEWFRRRPDGTVQYAENPPKKYQDIYPFNFETEQWPQLREELKDVFLFWIAQGVKIFRVDNPHTKPFPFWQWTIAEIKKAHPDVIFLSEAFTRPKIMQRLAKLGFTQSYTYFTWRNTKAELTAYFTDLTQTPLREYFWPNVWPNTPDILHEYLQAGGRTAFIARVVLAATLAANYGIYGPAFELGENQPLHPGGEEYLHSEKYQLRDWDLARADSLKDLIARVNRARRENPALQHDWSLRFHAVDNDALICYSKCSEAGDNVVLVVVNLDFQHTQSGWVDLSLPALGLKANASYQVQDLLTEARYRWLGARNYVQLDPHILPAHLFQVRRLDSDQEGKRDA